MFFLWCFVLQKPDYKRFQQERKETIRHFRHTQAQFHVVDESLFCLRGFEACLTVRAIQQKLVRRVNATQIVMETQRCQRRQGREDPSELQLAYHRTTGVARKLALKRAAVDANEVKEADCKETNMDDTSVLKSQVDRFIAIKADQIQPVLRPPDSGPLRLRKTASTVA